MPDHQEQNELVSTGFEELAQPAAPAAPAEVPQPVQTASNPVEESIAEAEAETIPASNDAPINIVQEGPPQISETARLNKEMFDKIMASRNTPPAVVPPQPVAPRILDQTRLEMAEGAKQVAKHAAARASQAVRRPTATDIAHTTTNEKVFRPNEVPKMNSLSDVQRGHKVL